MPTYYYGELGNVIDFIFVSNALNEKNKEYTGRVSEYKVFDRHLKCDDIENETQSDHATSSGHYKIQRKLVLILVSGECTC